MRFVFFIRFLSMPRITWLSPSKFIVAQGTHYKSCQTTNICTQLSCKVFLNVHNNLGKHEIFELGKYERTHLILNNGGKWGGSAVLFLNKTNRRVGHVTKSHSVQFLFFRAATFWTAMASTTYILLRFESRLRTLIDVSNIPLGNKNVMWKLCLSEMNSKRPWLERYWSARFILHMTC